MSLPMEKESKKGGKKQPRRKAAGKVVLGLPPASQCRSYDMYINSFPLRARIGQESWRILL